MSDKEAPNQRINIKSILDRAGKAQEKIESNVKPPRDAGKRAAKKDDFSTKSVSFMLPLPLSGIEIPKEYLLVDPAKCRVSPLNKRDQNLLSDKDPEIIQLEDSIARSKQRDPVLLRPLSNGEYELIYGSRRKFAVILLNKKNKNEEKRLLTAWVADVPDGEVAALADSENDDRVAISVYERSLFFKDLHDKKKWDVDKIISSGRIGKTALYDYLKIADIDVRFVKCLSSPNRLTFRSGLKLKKIIDNADDKKIESFLEISKENVYNEAKDLVKVFIAYTKETPKEKNDSNFPISYQSGGKVKAKLSKHRKNPGQYKIDLFAVDDKHVQKIQAFLSDISS